MIHVRAAVDAATRYASDLFGVETLRDLLLEEVEQSPDGKDWLITLGFSVPEAVPPSPLEQLQQVYKAVGVLPPLSRMTRKYKLFQIDGETGDVKAMRIREV